MKWIQIWLLGLLFFSFQVSAKDHFLIGFSQCSSGDWRDNMEREMKRELMFENDMSLIVKYAEDNANLQIKQINQLVKNGIDLLIVAPIETEAIQPLVEEIYKKGIPVILIDRKINSSHYSAYVGGDNLAIGNAAAIYIADQINHKGNVIEILGALSSSPAQERMNGFQEAIASEKGIHLVKRLYANWNNQMVLDSLPLILKEFTDVNAIYAHTDFLAAAANAVVKAQCPDKDIKIIGVDGSPGPGGGIELVEDGVITATLIYPTGGKQAIEIAGRILRNKPFNKENLLPTTVIDKNNVKITRLQYNNIEILQNDIERSQGMLELLGGKFRKQQVMLWVLLVFFALVIVLIILLYIALKNKNLANHRLEKQKEAISLQNQELKEISEQLEEATQSRLRFYTNISHEFRTPLTLIIGPLDNLIKNKGLDAHLKQELSVMHRNAVRLLRLINQLMDFRKIEMKKMTLSAGNYDLINFLKGIKESFYEMTHQKGIHLDVEASQPRLMMWFDWDKLDKVMFNLLSNAFKFTPNGGSIKIKVSLISEDQEQVCIEVEDNGEGIAKDYLDKIFDRFFQVEHPGGFVGTGIGLTLSRELIALHKGKIEAESTLGIGTVFKVYLPLGSAHLNQYEMIDVGQNQMRHDQAVISEFNDTISIETDKEHNEENSFLSEEEKPVLLIVEDEPDIRQYIKSCFNERNFLILEAENGSEGYKKVEEEGPDMIISDVMMPVMDGLELTHKVKNDIKYCHIPLILLTAKSSLDHMMEGLEEGADGYIPKPFNKEHLQLRVRKLLENQRRIQDKYQDSLMVKREEKGINRIDKKFLAELRAIILQDRSDAKVNVEDLSAKVGMSRVHLYRKIKKITGLSVSEFVNSTKLKEALILLRNTDKNVAEIAYEVGFSSPSYFTRCFKDAYQMSPSAYREQSVS